VWRLAVVAERPDGARKSHSRLPRMGPYETKIYNATRTVVLAHRNNLDAGGEWTPFTDSLTLEASLTPRASLVPRS
jgi:hypothetical protein